MSNWNITYGKLIELTESDEGYDFSFDGVQLVWIKPEVSDAE